MKTFCENCHEMVEYTEQVVEIKNVIRGKKIKIDGLEAVCPICKGSLFVAEIRDRNLMHFDHAFRYEENIISIDEIQDILYDYNIGKRPLSRILGWGELTITRYLEGALPTKQYSEKLFEIHYNPEIFETILDSKKDVITEIAYKKCKKELNAIISDSELMINSDDKIDVVAKYLLLDLTDISPLSLQKLLYYAQGFNTVFNGTFLFMDDCQAWVHGPVYSEIFQRYKNYGYNPIEIKEMNYEPKTNLSNSEKEVIDAVIKHFGCFGGKILEKMTHSELPWTATRNGINEEEPSNKIIEKELISSYFEQIKQKYNMIHAADISKYSMDLFNTLNK